MTGNLNHLFRCPALFDEKSECVCADLPPPTCLTHDEAVRKWGSEGLMKRIKQGRAWPAAPFYAAYWVDPIEMLA